MNEGRQEWGGAEHVWQFAFTLVVCNAIMTFTTRGEVVSTVVGIAGALVAWSVSTNHSQELINGDFKMRTMPNVVGRGIVLALSLFLAGGAGAVEGHPYRVIAAEQKEHRLVMLEPVAGEDPTTESAIVWEWRPEKDPGIPAAARKTFSNPDECKVLGNLIFMTASGGGFAAIDRATKRTVFYGFAGGNPHSIERLPDGRVVVASSEGNRLTLFDVASHPFEPKAQPQKVYRLNGAHGVFWDRERNCLWALGGHALERFAYDPAAMALKREKAWYLKDAGLLSGHDLVPAPGDAAHRRCLVATAHEGYVWFSIDARTEGFKDVVPVRDVKSISFLPNEKGEVGQTLRLSPKVQWWTDTFSATGPSGPQRYHLKDARFYKARYLK